MLRGEDVLHQGRMAQFSLNEVNQDIHPQTRIVSERISIWQQSPRLLLNYKVYRTGGIGDQHTHGHVQRRDREHISRRTLRLELAGWRTRGKAESRFMDVVKEEME